MGGALGQGGHLQTQRFGGPLRGGAGRLCRLEGLGGAVGSRRCRTGAPFGFRGVLSRLLQGPTQTGALKRCRGHLRPQGLQVDPQGLDAPGALLGLAVGLLECRPCLVALGLDARSGLPQILDLAPQGFKVAADLAQVRGGLPGLPAQIPKFRLLGLAAAAPFLGHRPLFAGRGLRLVVPLALLGEVS